MKEIDLVNIWKSYDNKLDKVLTLNKEMAFALTKRKLNKTINRMIIPKSIFLLIGVPYTLLHCLITIITFKAEAYIMCFGFACIAIIMALTSFGYFYHLVLISKVNNAESISVVQKRVADLKVSSLKIARLSIMQLPFWSICWISISALIASPIVYGGVNLFIILLLSYISYYLYRRLNEKSSKVSQLIFSGTEWTALIKSKEILDQLREYES